MWHGTAIWVCPALCGCELSITAEWVKEVEKVSGKRASYQHPRPKSIQSIEIASVCTVHDHFKTDPLPADPYNGSPGYINPIPASPSEAERLYIQLYRYSGQRFKPDTCGCSIYRCIDRLGVEPDAVKPHFAHSKKCAAHLSDDDHHTAAREENHRKNEALRKIKERFSQLTDDDLTWSYDEGRVLKIKTPKLVGAMRSQAQADHDPTKVVIE